MTQPVWPDFEQTGVLLQGSANQLSLRNQQVEAGNDRELHPGGFRLSLDFVGEQLLEHQRALAMAEQDVGTALVVFGQILLPRGANVGIGEDRGLGHVRAGGGSRNRAKRHLPIDGCEYPAGAGEAGELADDHRLLLALAGLQVAVHPRSRLTVG